MIKILQTFFLFLLLGFSEQLHSETWGPCQQGNLAQCTQSTQSGILCGQTKIGNDPNKYWFCSYLKGITGSSKVWKYNPQGHLMKFSERGQS